MKRRIGVAGLATVQDHLVTSQQKIQSVGDVDTACLLLA